MIKRVVLPIIIIVLAIAGFIALKTTKPVAEVIEKPETVWRVKTVTVEVAAYAPELVVYGRIETPRQTSLTAGINADVIQVNKFEGEQVIQGELIVQLDDVDEQLVLQQRQADVDEIHALFNVEKDTFNRDKALLNNQNELLKLTGAAVDRATRLGQSKLASQASLDDARANQQHQLITVKNLQHTINEHPARLAQLRARLNRAESLVGQSKRAIDRASIYSPFTGRISHLEVSLGERVRIGDSLLSIYDLSQLEVRAQIPSRVVAELNTMIADNTLITARAILNGEPVEFELSRLSGEVEVDSGGVDALFTLTSDRTVALGTFVELTLTLATHQDIISIPYNALYGLDRVYKVVDHHLIATDVSQVGELTLENGERKILVKSTFLQSGDTIITTQLPNAITGLKVETVDE